MDENEKRYWEYVNEKYAFACVVFFVLLAFALVIYAVVSGILRARS